MSKKIDILTTLSKGIYKDDNYSVVDKQVVGMINEYYRRFKQDVEFQGRMNITILSLDNLDGDAGDKLRWEKIKEALSEVYDKNFVDFTLINCRNIQEIESSFVDHANFVYNTYNVRTIVISRFEIFKDFAKSNNWQDEAYFIEWYDTKEEWEKAKNKKYNCDKCGFNPKNQIDYECPNFIPKNKSDKIEHKAALSQRWYFLLQENTWRDKNGNRHFVPNMSEDYIKNCILWLDETLCGKYIPDPELRRKFKSLFQNELSHRDTLNRLCNRTINVKELLDGKKFQDLHSQMAIKCGIDVNDLPSMSERLFSREDVIEEIVNRLKEFGTEEVIKYYQNMSAIEKPSYYWKELEGITSPINGSTEIPIKVRMMLNIIAHNNYKKIYEDKVGKESGRWSSSKHNYNDLEKNVNKQKAYGTKYWNMPYNELVEHGLWKDTKNNIYTISSMRNGHIANIMDMLNSNKYSLDMSPETKEKYKDLFLDEFRIRNALKKSEPQILSKEEHIDLHTPGKKENDMVSHPNHYAQTRIECIDAIEACIEPYQDPVDAYLTSNALKYIWRHPFKKNGREDLEKAIWYLNRLVDKYKKNEIKLNK